MKILPFMMTAFLTATAFAATDSFETFFDDVIREQEREVQELKAMKKDFSAKARGEKENLRTRLDQLREELREDFRSFTHTLGGEKQAPDLSRVEIRENAAGYDVLVNAPGMSPKEMNARIDGKNLIVTGVSQHEFREGKAVKSESKQIFQEIHLNERPDPKSLKVEFQGGVMKIHVNKATL